jgi:NAD(P)H-quinone oxidoreductase subunit 5
MLLVIAGNTLQLALAWIATSVFCTSSCCSTPSGWPPSARRARNGSWRAAGDAALIVGRRDPARPVRHRRHRHDPERRRRDSAPGATWVAAFLALAAILKSAQFPTHGWLTEVMETPTPVSALLHAGVINAGGFLLIRFADVMLLSPGVLAVLVMLGGFTALFGGLVMLTQSAVKTSLAWSTVAQMGFMILQCGLALFPLALLHIVAHSLYKAHAFLASGQAVDGVAAIRRPGPWRSRTVLRWDAPSSSRCDLRAWWGWSSASPASRRRPSRLAPS